jgi:predicted peptidase
MQKIALAALDQTLHEYNGDPDRVYLTGMSLGGYGTWELGRRFPNRWAAIAPVSGGIVYPGCIDAEAHETAAAERDPYGSVASRLRSMPVWVFHGAVDTVVPISEARQLVAALHALDAEVYFNEYAGVGHESWEYAYAEPNLLKWLLSHKLPHCGIVARSRRYQRR